MVARQTTGKRGGLAIVAALAVASLCGCVRERPEVCSVPGQPRELAKVSHREYLIEPPDILQIDLIAAVPKPPYRIKPLDVVGIVVPDAYPDAPIAGTYTVDPDGTVNLGPPYGIVSVSGKTIEEATKAVTAYLSKIIKDPVVSVSLAQTRAVQQIRGQHLVRADGAVSLGAYGLVRVVGMTHSQAKAAIEMHLADYFLDPEISLDIVGYNSKVYYVVFDYGGAGQQITRIPITGSETVLDGISQLNGLPTVADTHRIWLTRPNPDGTSPTILPVNWTAIVEQGDASTNYQVLPGDRICVKAYPLVETDTKLARLLAPVERVLGITLLGSSTVNSIRIDPNQAFGGGFGGGVP